MIATMKPTVVQKQGTPPPRRDKGCTMRILIAILISFTLCIQTLPVMGEEIPEIHRDATIGLLMERAIASNLIAGGVVVIGNSEGILSTTTRGTLDLPGAPPLTENTIFDLASLTKVVATAPAVMKLVDKKLVSLTDPISRWFPEFRKSRYGNITIINLLTHTSGLTDFNLLPGESKKSYIRKMARQRGAKPGSRFNYADVNFILLGELVHRVSGKPLDVFCRENLYKPLGARQTMFLPPGEIADTIAPTVGMANGVVQDHNARRLGGVAGHAGLFSSAADLAKFARMMLGNGSIDGKRVLSKKLVRQMTSPYYCSSKTVIRAPGWDMESPFSAPKGNFFSESSYGHTGYSGTSIWIDPTQDLFVIVLTTRLDYDNTRIFNQLRRDISTFAAAGFSVASVANSEARTPRDLPKSTKIAKASKKRTTKVAAAAKKKKPAKLSLNKNKKGKKPVRKQYSQPANSLSPLPPLSKSPTSSPGNAQL